MKIKGVVEDYIDWCCEQGLSLEQLFLEQPCLEQLFLEQYTYHTPVTEDPCLLDGDDVYIDEHLDTEYCEYTEWFWEVYGKEIYDELY